MGPELTKLTAELPRKVPGTPSAPLTNVPQATLTPKEQASQMEFKGDIRDTLELLSSVLGAPASIATSAMQGPLPKPPAGSPFGVLESMREERFKPKDAVKPIPKDTAKRATAGRPAAATMEPLEQFQESSLTLPLVIQALGAIGSTVGIATGRGDIGAPMRQLGANIHKQTLAVDQKRLERFDKSQAQKIALQALPLISDPKVKAALRTEILAGNTSSAISKISNTKIKDKDRALALQSKLMEREYIKESDKARLIKGLIPMYLKLKRGELDISDKEKLSAEFTFATGDPADGKKWGDIVSSSATGWFNNTDALQAFEGFIAPYLRQHLRDLKKAQLTNR